MGLGETLLKTGLGMLGGLFSSNEDVENQDYQDLIAENRQLKLELETAHLQRVEQGGLVHINGKYYRFNDGKLIEADSAMLEDTLTEINGEWQKAYEVLEEKAKGLIDGLTEMEQDRGKWHEKYVEIAAKYKNAIIPTVLTEVFSFKDAVEKEKGLLDLIDNQDEQVVARVKRGSSFDWCVISTTKNYDENGIIPFVGYSLKDGSILQFSSRMVVEYGKHSHYFNLSEDAPEDLIKFIHANEVVNNENEIVEED